MGMCLSSSYEGKEESDENIVCRVEEGGLCCNNGEEKEEEEEEGIKSLVSLYSQQGKKGPNQDCAILYQVPSFSLISFFIFVAFFFFFNY